MSSRPTVRKMFGGGAWLGLEQGLRLGLGLWVGAWVARYLGPEDFGLISAALAVVAVLGGFASLGLNTILVRDIATSPESAGEIQATAFFLKFTVSAFLWLGCVGLVWGGAWAHGAHGWLLPLASLALLFQAMDVVERRLQAQSGLRGLTLIRCAGIVTSFGLRVFLILTEASLEAFALAGVCEIAMVGAGLVWITWRSPRGFRDWSFSAERARAQLREGLPLMCAGVAIQIQGYSDQILIGAFCESEELGQYAAALRVVMIFAFVPIMLQTLAAPEIARGKAEDARLYRRRLGRLYRLATIAGLATAAPLALLGPTIIGVLFGDAYSAAGALLPLFALRLVLANLGVARGIFLTTEGMARFVLITAAAGALLNVGLNLVLIPLWGATGAIVASLVSFSVTTFGLEWTDKRARWNFRILTAAMLRPWRSID